MPHDLLAAVASFKLIYWGAVRLSRIGYLYFLVGEYLFGGFCFTTALLCYSNFIDFGLRFAPVVLVGGILISICYFQVVGYLIVIVWLFSNFYTAITGIAAFELRN